MTAPAPKSIKQVNELTLGITWSDGHDSTYSVKNLRTLDGDALAIVLAPAGRLVIPVKQ